MGIDYNPELIYGKEYDSFSEALQDLLDREVITEEYDSIGEAGDYIFTNFNSYSGSEGVLGIQFNPDELYYERDKVTESILEIDKNIGEGCKFHFFVNIS